MNKLRIAVPAERIAAFCRMWNITQFSLFGSVLREDFRPESDIDVLVTFSPEARSSVFDLIRMKGELEQLFGRNVDLVDRRVIEQSENYLRRRSILDSAEVLYES